jgi:hypothetical protein
MKVGISPDDGRSWLREPITRGLLASALLHFAFVTLFQSSPPDGSRQVVVINARLQQAAPVNQTALAEPVEPQPVAEPVVATESLLTALTPSAAPPVPGQCRRPAATRRVTGATHPCQRPTRRGAIRRASSHSSNSDTQAVEQGAAGKPGSQQPAESAIGH